MLENIACAARWRPQCTSAGACHSGTLTNTSQLVCSSSETVPAVLSGGGSGGVPAGGGGGADTPHPAHGLAAIDPVADPVGRECGRHLEQADLQQGPALRAPR